MPTTRQRSRGARPITGSPLAASGTRISDAMTSLASASVAGGTASSVTRVATYEVAYTTLARSRRASARDTPPSIPAGSRGSGQRVAHHLALDQEHDHLGDVRGMVGDALQEARDQDEPDRARDRLRVAHHVREQLAEDLLLDAVHLVVSGADLARQVRVPGHEGVQALLHHALGLLGHSRQVDVRLELALLVQLHRALGDVHRLVADALEVGDDLHGGGDEAEVAGGRLVEGEQLHALLVDLDVVSVHLPIAVDDVSGQRLVTLHQRPHGAADLILDQRAHGQQRLLEAVQLLVEVSLHSLPPESRSDPWLGSDYPSHFTARLAPPFRSFHRSPRRPSAPRLALPEPSGDVVLGPRVVRAREQRPRDAELDQLAEQQESRVVRDARRLLHV